MCGSLQGPDPCHRMFVRFRHTKTGLQASIVETHRVRRVHGAIRQRILASLGSIPRDPSPQDRLRFWQNIDVKLDRLSDRIDGATQAKLRGEIYAKIPLPGVDTPEKR